MSQNRSRLRQTLFVIFLEFLLFDEINCIEAINVVFTGKTELAKQVARYMHKDIKKVCH